MAQARMCIVCERTWTAESDMGMPLKYFDDACICRDCLEQERSGWRKDAAAQGGGER